MKRRLLLFILLIAVGAAPIALYYWPRYTKHRLISGAQSALAAGNLTGADELLTKLIRLDPDNAQAHFLEAKVLRGLGRSADAMAHLSRSTELGYDHDQGRREYGLLFAPLDFSLAEGALQRVLDQAPDDKEVLQAL